MASNWVRWLATSVLFLLHKATSVQSQFTALTGPVPTGANQNASCFYVSQAPKFPYGASAGGEHAAERACQDNGWQLAVIESREEFDALLNLAICHLSDRLLNSSLSVGYDSSLSYLPPNATNVNASNADAFNCFFLDPLTRSLEGRIDGQSCVGAQSADPAKQEPFYVCKAPGACVSAEYTHDALVCSVLSLNSSQLNASQLSVTAEHQQDTPFCAGKKVQLQCDAGGFNAFKDDPTQNSTELECLPSLEFRTPDPWPECSDTAHCPLPLADGATLQMDYDIIQGRPAAGTNVTYTCKNPLKQVISRQDLSQADESGLMSSLPITCQSDASYSADWEDYTCTKSCSIPGFNPALMAHDWPDIAVLPELGGIVNFMCHNHSVVSFADFQSGKEDFTSLSSLPLSCHVSGKLRPPLTEFSCTVDCDEPQVDPDVMDFDYTGDGNPVLIGDPVSYTCKNPSKQIVHLSTLAVTERLTATCKFNGKYSVQIDEYACTECDKPEDVADGYFECDSPVFAKGSSCYLRCNEGFIPSKLIRTTCYQDSDTLEDVWDRNGTHFECSRPINLVIGGMSADRSYLREVEVYAPGLRCSGGHTRPLPRPLLGPVAAFLAGRAIICGGAREDYADCRTTDVGTNKCKRNIDCVETKGGTPWCSGPKTDKCLVYDATLTREWLEEFQLKKPRAFAASVLLPDGRLWILGGLSNSSAEQTTEMVSYNASVDAWNVKSGPAMTGPRFGHCAQLLPDGKNVLVTGGYNEDNYEDFGEMYNLETRKWLSKTYLMPKAGRRIDHACGNVHLRGLKRPLVVGGHNQDGTFDVSETYSEQTKTWTQVGSSLPHRVRSGLLIQQGQEPPVYLGGVHCHLNETVQRQTCTRSRSALQYVESGAGQSGDSWEEVANEERWLSTARSGMVTMLVPKGLISGC